MTEKIGNKATKSGNYVVELMTPLGLGKMGPQDIKNTVALIISKNKPELVQTVSVKNLSILAQAMCPLPEVMVAEVGTVIRYANLLPNGQLLISYFGAMPSQEIIDALTKLAGTAVLMNGAIFPGYAALTPAVGKEKHFSPDFTVPDGITNIRVMSEHEIIFGTGKELKKMLLNNIAVDRWDRAMAIGSFTEPILFLDRIKLGITNVVTKDHVVRGYSLQHKRAGQTLAQSKKLKVLSFVQWVKTAVITTPLGLTQEPVHAHAA